MNNPLFSVLIANYNNGRYLQEAINSVLTQTYTNWEIVIVDDKSTDNSFEIYEKYKNDSRFHIYLNNNNKGCGFTKSRCVKLAHGELCGFLDPDDKLDQEAVDVMVKEHETYLECSLIYSTHYLWNDYSEIRTVQDMVGKMLDGEDFLISSYYCISHFATFKKSAYDNTEGIDEKLPRTVDVDLYLKLEETGKCRFVNKTLYYYRQTNPNSISIGVNALPSYRIICSLAAFCRRIKTRSPLFTSNREKYLFRMREQMGSYKRRVGHVDKYFIHYCFWYWIASRFSLRALNHIKKLLLI